MTQHVVFIEASSTGAGEKSAEYAKNTGRYTTLVCNDPFVYPPQILDHIDNILMTNAIDVETTIEKLNLLHLQRPIEAILTTHDSFLVQSAKFAERFSLPTTSSQNVAKIKNKYSLRRALNKINPDLNPDFSLAHSLVDAIEFSHSVGFPFIAKPPLGFDSIGVWVIEDERQLRHYFQTLEQNDYPDIFKDGVLLEGIIDGEEFCLDVLKPWKSDFICMGAFEKILAGQEKGYHIKIGATFPSPDAETQLLFDSIAPALHELGINVGAVNVDCKIDRHGTPKIIEVNQRLVGDQMGSHMIELATGLNPAHKIVEAALGNNIDWSPLMHRFVAIHRITMSTAGIFQGILNSNELSIDKRVKYVNQLGRVGEFYDEPTSNLGVVGSIIAIGNTATEAMGVARDTAINAKVAYKQELMAKSDLEPDM